MVSLRKKIQAILIPRQGKSFFFLVGAVIVDGILETIGIASIMPFLAVLANPQIIHTNKVFSYLYDSYDFASETYFLFFLGFFVLLVLVISNSFAALTRLHSLRFIYLRGHFISYRLFQKYLASPYSFFLNRNSSDLVKNITTESQRIVLGVISPVINMMSKVTTAFCILFFLLLVDPLLAIIVFIVCGGSYIAVFALSKKKLAVIGQVSTQVQGDRYKIANEALGGIKDLKLLGREKTFLDMFAEKSSSFASCEAASQAIATLPKFALETIIFGGILLIMLYLIGVKNEMHQVLPVLGVYAFAGYRLMPGLNLIFHGSSLVRFHSSALDLVYNDLFGDDASDRDELPGSTSDEKKVVLKEAIWLKDISFTYPGARSPIFSGLDLSIKVNSTVAFVGKTGSGKTTLVDIILGLLVPDSGEFYVDAVRIDRANVKAWQKNIGYVPQHIFLADDTVTRNIAFGIPDEEIDYSAVWKAAELASIDGFVRNELADGYATYLGERGVRLSGGQRQRIGIARALYHDPQVLVLDEATSALDGATESAVMEAVRNLSQRKTIIMIAHRITTVEECDQIYLLQDGEFVAHGDYPSLLRNCPQFQEMVHA